ncbi:MAG: V-type ATP synthase subunit D, partial [Clostridia bacterium]|nr:V-type ATP synthase subunit D [Clostridia bacterium]
MGRLNVNPTRMELRGLKTRLTTAVRGHKLLKDKSDETIRQFMIYIKENKRLRDEIENEVTLSLRNFLLASAVNSREVIEEAVAMPSRSVQLKSTVKNIMSVSVPSIEIEESESTDLYPYSF